MSQKWYRTFRRKKILGKKIKKNIVKGDLIKWEDLKS